MIEHSLVQTRLGNSCSSSRIYIRFDWRWRYRPNHNHYQMYRRHLPTGKVVSIPVFDHPCFSKFLTWECLFANNCPTRTNCYNYISGFYFLASVCGSSIGSLLLSHHVYLLNGLSIFCYAATALVALAIPSELGLEGQKPEYDVNVTPVSNEDDADTSLSSSFDGPLISSKLSAKARSLPSSSFQPIESRLIAQQLSLLRIILNSWHATYHTLMKLFQLSHPARTVLLIYLFNGLASRTEVLLPQYTSLRLSWRLATVNMVMALKALISALVLFILPTLRRIYLEPRMSVEQIDLFITQASLVANTIGIIGLGMSAPAGFLVMSLCVYTSGTGLADSLTAYGTVTLPPGEQVAEIQRADGFDQYNCRVGRGPLVVCDLYHCSE